MLVVCCQRAGTRFQATGNQDEEKDVVAEHEDKADSFGHSDCLNSHHSVIHLWWFQLLIFFLCLIRVD